jgi:hypothetical protein
MPALHDRFRSLVMLVHVPVALFIVRPSDLYDLALLALGFVYAFLVERAARRWYQRDIEEVQTEEHDAAWLEVERKAREKLTQKKVGADAVFERNR